MLEKLVNIAKINESDITFCNHYLVFSDRKENACDLGFDIKFIGDKVNQYIQMFMLKGKKDFEPYFPIGQPWGTLYKANIILDNNIRFEERMQYKEDVIFNLYVAQHSSTIVRINEPLYYYNKCNTNSLTTSGLKKGMLPRVEMDIMKRTEFYMKHRVGDELFAEGLFQHTFRSFYRNIVPACVVDANYKRCKDIYISQTFQNAFIHVNIKYFNILEKSIYFLIRYHGLWFYYSALLIYKTVLTRDN